MDGKLAALRDVPMFAGYRRNQLRRVASLVDTVDVHAGVPIAEEGARRGGREALLVADGHGTVVSRGAVIADVGPGDFVRSASAIDRGPEIDTVIAETSMTLLAMDRLALLALLEEDTVAYRFTRQLVTRLRHALDEADRRSASAPPATAPSLVVR